jgi:hypothetical protein
MVRFPLPFILLLENFYYLKAFLYTEIFFSMTLSAKLQHNVLSLSFSLQYSNSEYYPVLGTQLPN